VSSTQVLEPTAFEDVFEPSEEGAAPGRGASAESVALARIAAAAAADKLGRDIVALDVSQKLGLTDIFVIVSGNSDRQVWAIVDAVEERLLREGVKPVRREGDREARWVLLDFYDLVVHVQLAEARALFNLDRLWHDCPAVDLDLDEAVAAA
jgi:ribosome-associated protein